MEVLGCFWKDHFPPAYGAPGGAVFVVFLEDTVTTNPWPWFGLSMSLVGMPIWSTEKGHGDNVLNI